MLENKKNQKEKSEYELEKELINQLVEMGYKKIEMPKYDPKLNNTHIKFIEENFRKHFNRINQNVLKGKTINEDNFYKNIIKEIINNTPFQNAELFRNGIQISRENEKGIWILYFYDKKNIENNVFEVSNQVVQDGKYGNRCDVTIFMNGIPIVQIELKKRGVELQKAFKQIKRYIADAYDNNIYKMCQLFVISNNTYTKYFSNNNYRKLNIKNCFKWQDEKNENKIDLFEFASSFLNKKTLFKMINEYTVISVADEEILTLRPYQYYAVEKVINHIETNNKLNDELVNLEERSRKLNAYVWHATGSGKTLTSFKIADILKNKPYVYKVIFLVDRSDLNYQTAKNYKKFLGRDANKLEDTNNCSQLKEQLKETNKNKLIVTTMQKMNNLLREKYFVDTNRELFKKKYIFIIDECHRSQFGEMNDNLRRTFVKSRFIGFTGTPILSDDALKYYKTTDEIFGGKAIHTYLMKDAINDENILPFTIEYIRVFKEKDKLKVDSISDDVEVESIDEKEVYYTDEYISTVSSQIKKDFNIKTKNKKFKAMLVCRDIECAIKYHKYFRENFYDDIKIATLFSRTDNDQLVNEDKMNSYDAETVRSKQDEIINDYSFDYNVKYDLNSFKEFSNNVQKRIKDENLGDNKKTPKLNLIIVVRMLTTGFDARNLNTIYLDRNLQNYDLIQTISRANRIFDERKNTANIVSFCTTSKNVDKALAKYNNENYPPSNVLIKKGKLDDYIKSINKEIEKLIKIWPTSYDIDNEQSEISIKRFIHMMKNINKLFNICESFIYFKEKRTEIIWNDDVLKQYRDVQKEKARRVVTKPEKYSILSEIDFGIEILKEDVINVDYILNLLKKSVDNAQTQIDLINIIEEFKEKNLKNLKKSLQILLYEWLNKIKLVDISEIKNKNLQKYFNDFCIESVQKSIRDFAGNNNCNYVKLVDTCNKVKRLKMEINSLLLENEIENCINDYEMLSFPENIEKIDLVSKFLAEQIDILNDFNITIEQK